VVVGFFEHGNENPGYIKCEEFLNQLRNYNILKRDLVANRIEITNQMRLCSRIYYSSVS